MRRGPGEKPRTRRAELVARLEPRGGSRGGGPAKCPPANGPTSATMGITGKFTAREFLLDENGRVTISY